MNNKLQAKLIKFLITIHFLQYKKIKNRLLIILFLYILSLSKGFFYN